MKRVKENVVPLVLLLAGSVLGVYTVVFNGMLIFHDEYLLRAAAGVLYGLLYSALFITLAFLAKAYYAKSQKLLVWLKWLRGSTYAFCLFTAVQGLYGIYSAASIQVYGPNSIKAFELTNAVLEPLVIISACLIALDLISEYMELKAESSLTV